MQNLAREADGFEILGLENEQVSLWIAPALGAKWVSLRDRRRDREWMWSPPDRDGLFRAPDANAFHTSSLIGADECFPTIAPAQWAGRALPDHGEVWNLPWTVIAHTPATLTTQIDLPISPLRLTRAIELDAATLTVDYRVENRGDAPEPFVWAFHPLLKIGPGDQLALGPAIGELLLESAIGVDLGKRGAVCAWPAPQTAMDLSRLELGGDARAAKFFTHPLPPGSGWAQVYNSETHTSLTYTFSSEQVNTLGIWLTRGGWNGYHHLAVEPGIGAPDPLDVAVADWERFGTVAPAGEKTWRFQLTLGT
ncbi:MAG: hypothetical protein WDZ49_09285 [Litorilinea sp.]